ncbi:G-type lectin S-receptor-like serine/threonine-protein kinase At1g11330 [Rhodamnia argentea]|uniref:G-type lectin S-receptor-like serine/threonine-protein kinase At1g11330 n=1 Tax=Rhodamnia argentea TaxID=178133 RepID=A0A8B8P2W6_9MYRT|nr:G-type lectin S-receptor-like serine/threonine-protein kinase At1g11330 [Rhodamnia argentea]
MKVPNFGIWFSTTEDDCQGKCCSNSSCVAYAYDTGVGCMHCSRDLIDLQKFSTGGTTLYVRLAHSEHDEKRHLREIIATTVITGTLIVIVTIWLSRRKAKKRAGKESKEKHLSSGEAPLVVSNEKMLGENLSRVEFQEFVKYKIGELAAATGNFVEANKLGRGGFGPVYKGTLPNGQEIAIKRLSKASGQGQQEFMNEMVVICKVQHRNLVRLLGCCVEGDERMLIYEFMPNKSLDTFLFDPLKRVHLDWRTRFNIVDGICRGLLYLHRDSRLRIIHRDLKAGNILLDEELNPKISDFGMARIFGGNENQANTRRVVGTYGYMAPEYAMEGRFSEKSDVFSFGILLLEIISGRRNSSFHEEDECLSLLGLAWKLWNEDNVLELVDPNIPVTCFAVELSRCINVGLLCTQERAKDRPSISTVISMINSEIVDLPRPKQPAFTVRKITQDTDSSGQSHKTCSANDVTLTALHGKIQVVTMVFLGKARLFSLYLMSHYFVNYCIGGDVITATEYIQDPGSITSSGGIYRMGFFGPNGSANRYVGIWYSNVPSYNVLWVANREKPILDSSGIVTISGDGNLVVLNGKRELVWSSNVSNPEVTDAKAQLLDSGNLVLLNQSSNSSATDAEKLWESFQHMTDSFLAKMKLITSSSTNETQALTSWKSPSDPSIGSFSASLDPQNIPELIIWNGSSRYWRSGPWNGNIFIGVPKMQSVYINGYSLQDDHEGTVYLTYSFAEASYFSYLLLKSNGDLVQPYWDQNNSSWEIDWSSRVSDCDVYGKCGPFGICNAKKSPICSCLRGFEPKNSQEWSRGNWTSGCIRKSPLQCNATTNVSSTTGKKDGFLKLETMKLPNSAIFFSTLEGDCPGNCSINCSCVAYAYDSGVGCMLWIEDLIDLQKFSVGGTTLYVRLAHSELDEKRHLREIIATTVVIGTLIVIVTIWFARRKVKKLAVKERKEKHLSSGEGPSVVSNGNMLGGNLSRVEFQEFVKYKIGELAAATGNFGEANKLGRGGFGPVYKGTLPNGQEIAIKRLSKASGQGQQEFMNEMVVICKVQHRNLVRLLGCCVEGDERMLIYEFMPNKSLDTFLFDPLKRVHLDWRTRFNIVDGICRGLLYLHRDSRLRIIHRDLKAGNILLDEELNPKISDFGMARIFGGNENQANTRRVVGTYGYMAPEYAMEGRFSEKSDVFSFGILLLEIISGRRNSSFHEEDECLSLLGLAWKLWNEDNVLELVDPNIPVTCFAVELSRCINVGLLCTQEKAKDRPSISTVISMINSEIVDLPRPKQPAFTVRKITQDTDSSGQSHKTCSANDVTLTALHGR